MTAADEWLEVESLDLEAQGVAHNAEGKVVFIEGALPGERVQVQVHRRKNQWEQASVTAIARETSQRVRPACPHFGLHAGACGGCKMQHLHPSAQIAVKQRALEDNAVASGQGEGRARILRPLEGPAYGYRHTGPGCRCATCIKKGAVLVGFHERKSQLCRRHARAAHVLPPHVRARCCCRCAS